MPGFKLTQSEMLDALSPAPFNQSTAVPMDAAVETSSPEQWFRSDSPGRESHRDLPDEPDSTTFSTRGVLGYGKRTGPGCYQTSYQTGSGTASTSRVDEMPKKIAGYGGHIAGKYAGNCIGGTFDKSNADAMEHLMTTSQARLYNGLAVYNNLQEC